MFIFVGTEDRDLRTWISKLTSDLFRSQNTLTIVQTSVPVEEVRQYALWPVFSLVIIADNHPQYNSILEAVKRVNSDCRIIVLTQDKKEGQQTQDIFYFDSNSYDDRIFTGLVYWLFETGPIQ